MKDLLVSSGEKPYYNLGEYGREIHTTSQEARKWFNRGLVWCYLFNHEAATQCFETAAAHDPNCAMAYWGIAFALGPNYNKSWRMFTSVDRQNSLRKILSALARAEKVQADVSPIERALISALATRFLRSSVAIPEDLSRFDYAYAEAMRSVYEAYGEDLDITTLFADAVMCTRPRQLWNLNTGKTTGADIDEARIALEKGLAQVEGRNHPGLCHLYIHMMEMSPFPELALNAADNLRRLVPDGSHMQHMATHIDTACGDYRRSVDSNFDAIRADDKSADALYAARRLPEVLSLEFMSIKTPRMVDWTEWQLVTLPHALIRFGQWEKILQLRLPANRDLLSVMTATVHYAQGIAFAVLGRITEACHARDAFEDARKAVPDNPMLEGELEYRKGNHSKAFSILRHAINLEDNLAYADPPLWMQPVRHAFSALLLEQGYSEEAEKLYLEDLGLSDSHPRRKARINNVWGLHGLYESFMRNGKEEKAKSIRIQRDIAMAASDVPIKASCFCRLSAIKRDYDCHS
ncbi:tpr domain protein [Alternaria burnsii]|uniref:Tpr domain protein n=1 Tax=Alternaria burnsii TaxID=1187904 RepID=A0A8H7EBD6_9PLEO|nr:tpr domain protein [Alternaria burnsii]KAF7671367.1 tpr domain protein [Alternaria burnsii]